MGAESHQQVLLQIGGMTCEGCAGHVRQALQHVAGVTGVEVDLESQTATVRYIVGVTGFDDLQRAVTGAGYEVLAHGTCHGAGEVGRSQGPPDAA